MPARSLSVRVGADSTSEKAVVSDARDDLPPPMTPADGVPIVQWETAPATPNPAVHIVAPVAPRASDAVWGAPRVSDPVSVLPEEFIEPIDPPTDLPGIEGFLDALDE